jgi:hypothetical protein
MKLSWRALSVTRGSTPVPGLNLAGAPSSAMSAINLQLCAVTHSLQIPAAYPEPDLPVDFVVLRKKE